MKNKKTLFLASLFILCIALSTLNATAENETNQTGDLVINNLEINVDYEPTKAYNINNLKDSQTGLVNGSTTEADVYPGSTVEFVFEIENTFERADDDSDDVTIDDVFVKVIIEGIAEDEEDIEKESETIELEPEEERDFFVSLKIPQKVDAGTYDVKIEVEGDGSDDVRYTIDWNLKLELKKPSHDIRIENINLVDTNLKCDRSTELTAKIYNAGRNSEDDVKLEIANDNLNIKQYVDKIALGTKLDTDNGDEIDFEKKFPVSVADSASAGTYPIDVNVYWKDILFNTKSVDLVIEDCEERQPQETTTTTTTTVPEEGQTAGDFIILTGDITEEPEPTTNESEEDIFVSTEFSLRKSPMFLPLIVGLNLVLIIVVVGIGVGISSRKQE